MRSLGNILLSFTRGVAGRQQYTNKIQKHIAMQENNYCIIMGGGIGSRFWPFSREHKPKQFLDIFGTGRSLLQMTFERFASFIPKSNIIIVTNEIYREQVLEQLPDIQAEQILLEPIRRNTAPCIAYACYHILARNPHANIVVSPSDHLILNEVRFAEDVQQALAYVASHADLVTLGVRPSRPETGYGYIQMGRAKDDAPQFHGVKTFTEKPNLEMAQIFLASGEFLWNSGMFIWNIKTIMSAFRTYLPDLCSLLDEGEEVYATPREHDFISEVFPRSQSISIDYGVMEKAANVTVLPVDFGWADLGTWGSLYELKDKDPQGNVTLHAQSALYNATGNIISVDDPEMLVVVEGISDCIIAQSDKVLLICKKEQEQSIKLFMSEASAKYDKKYD